jgi:hypothetical protein
MNFWDLLLAIIAVLADATRLFLTPTCGGSTPLQIILHLAVIPAGLAVSVWIVFDCIRLYRLIKSTGQGPAADGEE